MDRLGYFGISWGVTTAPMMIAVEPRIKTAVLVVGGMFPTPTQPEVDPLNFLTRVTVPTRMVNFSADYNFPLETSAKPFYKLLGGAPKDMVEHPVSDEIFEVYRRLYAYDASPLNAELIKREDAEHWMRDEIEIDASYGNERLTAFLYLPHDVEPPY